MAKKKYYAVRKGRKTGIFNTWDGCQVQINGYSNAVYCSFDNRQDAEAYMNLKSLGTRAEESHKLPMMCEDSVMIYSDGSYNSKTKAFSCGYCVLDHNDSIIREFCGYSFGDIYSNASSRNVAGELLGAIHSIDWAIKNKYNTVYLYYDYVGIEKWASDEWKANLDLTKIYKEIMFILQKRIKIIFIKVKAHSNNKYNDIADQLAKKGLELEFDDTKLPIPNTYFHEILRHYSIIASAIWDNKLVEHHDYKYKWRYKDEERPKGVCYDCRTPYKDFTDLSISDNYWEKINPTYNEGAGLLCPTCICDRLEYLGLLYNDTCICCGSMKGT